MQDEASTISFSKTGSAADEFLRDVISGLNESQKRLPSKYFYDQRGSQLFDQICLLDEYYLTRTELEIMQAFAPEMADQIGSETMLIEFGSGSSVKTRLLLDELLDPVAYVPVDVSGEHLHESAATLGQSYPDVEILPVCADFTVPFELPIPNVEPKHKLVYFPGSTIGNFEPTEVSSLLRRIATLCGKDGELLIGIDLKKEAATIEAAYNDEKGVTAEFNYNLLRRINRELGANFQLKQFRHQAAFNEPDSRIEMHLVSEQDQVVSIRGEAFEFSEGETICTEYSHKYAISEFDSIAARSGLTLQQNWTDSQQRFAVLLCAVQS